MELIVSYEEPFGFVLWNGSKAVGKYDSFRMLLNALEFMPDDVTFKFTAITRLVSLIDKTII